MKIITRKIYDWAAEKVHSPFAPLWLGLIFLLEIVLFLPLDAILMLFCLEKPSHRYIYVGIAAIASTLSGLIAFFLGYLLWEAIGPYVIDHLISADFFDRLVHHYNQYENWAVFIGSLLPVPFKAIALSAGFCHLTLIPFGLCVFLARVVRFSLIAELIARWGDKIKLWLDRHLHRVVVAIGAKIAIAFAFFWALGSG